MQVGDLVKVKTKHYGTKIALVTEVVKDSFGCDVLVQPLSHHRKYIRCNPSDVEVISASR
jgi:hypothetical protein